MQAVATLFAASAAAASFSWAGLPASARVAAPAGFYEAWVLEPAASFVARKPITVWCAKTTASWRRYLTATSGTTSEAHGLAVPGSDRMHLDFAACSPLKAAWRGERVYVPTLSDVLAILTHEAIHLRGEVDEGVTDCAAMHEVPGVAVRFFHVAAGKKLRALMKEAWIGHASQGLAYRSVC